MKKIFSLIITFALCLGLAACAPWAKIRENKVEQDASKLVSFSAPLNWMQLMQPPANASNWRYTRDGFAMQELVISYDTPEVAIRSLSGKHDFQTQLKLEEDFDSSELADQFLGQLQKAYAALNLNIQVLERGPATIANRDAYRLLLTWKNAKGLDYQQEIYGTVYKGKLLIIAYSAIRKNFWQRDYPQYQQLLASVKLR